MTTTTHTFASPAIVVSDADHERLTSLAVAVSDRIPDVAEELLAEMERANVVAEASLPADVVRMGSSLSFRADDGRERHVTLVYPAEADIAAGKVSVLTPVGAALIGLAEGQSIEWTARGGDRHRLTVLAVDRVPVAA